MKEFTVLDGFCDERGMINQTLPRSLWASVFTEKGDSTTVNIEISFNKLEDLVKTIETGFKEGFTAGLENLDYYLSTQFSLRKQNKTNNMARVTTYLNFPGQTEEAKYILLGLYRFINSFLGLWFSYGSVRQSRIG